MLVAGLRQRGGNESSIYLTNWGLNFTVVATEPNPDAVSVQVSVPASQAAFGDMFGFWGNSTLTATVTMRKEG